MSKPIIALLYDFDKTLCTQDMQNYAFIPSLGMTPEEFWREANGFGRQEHMDGILAYMYTMLRKSREKGLSFSRGDLVEMGRSIVLFPGVRDWFARINAFGESLGVEVEHYILSSGLREIIEGSGISMDILQMPGKIAALSLLDIRCRRVDRFITRIGFGAGGH